MSLPPERPNRGAIRAGCVAVTQASASSLSDSCPTPVGVPSEAPGSAGEEASRRGRRDDICDGAYEVGCARWGAELMANLWTEGQAWSAGSAPTAPEQ